MPELNFRHLGIIALLAGAWYFNPPAPLPASPNPSSSIVWQNTAGGVADDGFHSVQNTTDGGCIAAGFTSSREGTVTSSHGRADVLIARFDAVGNQVWHKTFGGSENDIAHAISPTQDGGWVVTGTTSSSDGDVDQPKGAEDIWVLKLNGSGELQWQTCLGGSGEDNGTAIQQTTDGGYIVAGTHHSQNGDVGAALGETDAWLVRLDENGAILWEKSFGGPGNDLGFAVQQTSEGGFLLGGAIDSEPGELGGDYGLCDSLLVKTTADGTIEWQKVIGGKGEDVIHSVEQTNDAGSIVCGYTHSRGGGIMGNHGGSDILVMKFDSDGTLQWQKCFGGECDDTGRVARQFSDGGFIVIGSAESHGGEVQWLHNRSDLWFLKLANDGTLEWQKCLGGGYTDHGCDLRMTPDRQFLLAGCATPQGMGDIASGSSGTDGWVLKVKP